VLRKGEDWIGRHGGLRIGLIRRGMAGMAESVPARRGKAGTERRSTERLGKARLGRRGLARGGTVWRGRHLTRRNLWMQNGNY
jgi:hypothetical protein